MVRRSVLRRCAWWPVLGLLVLALAAPVASASRATGSLAVTPDRYVGGQQLTFEGKLGNDKHPIHLQFHMNRPGDRWTDIDSFNGSTRDDGTFRFHYPAPAMFGISLRVVGGGLVTPGWTFSAQSQEVLVTAKAVDLDLPLGVAVAGLPFALRVDTAPDVERRHDLPPPVFPGRTVTLQQRVRGHHWTTLDSTQVDEEGKARFLVTEEVPGQVVYRVRQEDWTESGDQVGWFPSFPVPVEVLAGLPRVVRSSAVAPAPTSDADSWAPLLARVGPQTTASQVFGWAPSQWDFGWEYGESLTSPPHKGTVRRGKWIDASNGSGRAVHYNGGLLLDSRWGANTGPGDHGDTWVTLRGNPMRYGRWEVRLRPWATETSAEDYTIRAELIPDDKSQYACGARTITMVEVDVHKPVAHYGVRAIADRREWTGTESDLTINQTPHAFGVEVTKKHITWFVDGRAVATVKDTRAISGVPLTMRLTLEGDGNQEMNRTRAIWDWQRGFTLDHGRKVTSDQRLDRGRHAITC